MKITSRQLRKIIKEEIYLYESTAPDKLITSGIFQAIRNSKFWEMPHKESNVDLVDDSTWSTPAIEILMDALNDAAKDLNTDLYFILSVTDDELYTLGPDDQYGGYPNNWMMRGQYRGPEKGKHIVWLEFRPVADDYDINALDPEELVKIISRTINHELVHYNQLKSQSAKKGISEEEAWEELQCDPNQIQVTDPEEWEKRCGRKPPETVPGRPGYLSLHNEIDAFAYEASEHLLDEYTPDEALDLIKRRDSKIKGVVGDYRKYLKDDRKSLERFLTKLYTNIKKVQEEETQSLAHST